MEKINMFWISNLFYSFNIIPTLPNYFPSFHCLYISGHLVRHDSYFYRDEAIFTGLVRRSDEPSETLTNFFSFVKLPSPSIGINVAISFFTNRSVNGQNPEKCKVLLHEAQVCALVFANKLQKRVLFRTDQSTKILLYLRFDAAMRLNCLWYS